MSRFIRFQRFGSAEVLAVHEQPLRAPSADEVVVRVEAIGVSWDDILWRQNLAMAIVRLPAGLGSEMAGVVEVVGEGVSDLKAGDRVASFQIGNVNEYPTYGERVLLPRSALTRYPHTLSRQQASVHYTPFLSAYFGYVDLARVEAGQTVLVTDGAHSPGAAFIQMGKALGVRVIAIAQNAEDASWVARLGADVVLDGKPEQLLEDVMAATDGKGVSAVFDGLGGEQMSRLGDVLSPRGSLVLYGLGAGNSILFPAVAALSRNIQFHVHCLGNFTGKYELGIQQDAAAMERALVAINMLTADGALALDIDRVFTFEQVAEAHHYLEGNPVRGHVVLDLA